MKTGAIPLRPTALHNAMSERGTDFDISGHVERTNDRDYEVEERSRCRAKLSGSRADGRIGDTELWSQLQTGSRKKRKAILIP